MFWIIIHDEDRARVEISGVSTPDRSVAHRYANHIRARVFSEGGNVRAYVVRHDVIERPAELRVLRDRHGIAHAIENLSLVDAIKLVADDADMVGYVMRHWQISDAELWIFPQKRERGEIAMTGRGSKIYWNGNSYQLSGYNGHYDVVPYLAALGLKN